jgi:hypothetical protein
LGLTLTTWAHLNHLGSLGLTLTQPDSLDFLDHTKKKGRPTGAKGKRDGAQSGILAWVSIGNLCVRP